MPRQQTSVRHGPAARATRPRSAGTGQTWVSTSRRNGTTWVFQSDVSRSPGGLPSMPRCVWSALSEIDELSQSAGSELWLHAAAARATNVVTYGEGVAAVARAVTAAGNAHKVVRCVDQSEARRVAQILALSGDIVVVGPGGYAIFPLSCGRPVRQGA